MWRGPTEPGQVLELRFGFSLRGVEQAGQNLHTDSPTRPPSRSPVAAFDARQAETEAAWRSQPGQDPRRDEVAYAPGPVCDRALPLVDQAVLCLAGESILAERWSVRL